jgi:hypothetical protein
MQTLKKFYFGKQKFKVNTYIGGIGGTINTPTLLATELGISENRIKLFKITGLDIECSIIGGSYVITGIFSFSNIPITYFYDELGLCVGATNGRMFENVSSNPFLYFPNLNPSVEFGRNSSIGEINLSNATSINSFFTKNAISVKRFIVPRVINMGSSALNDNIHSYIVSKSTWYVNPFLQTNNAGAEDGDIVYARNQGATIRYVTNFNTPNKILDLSVGQVYNAAIQLNFTPPNSTNAIDFYEVYLNNSIVPFAEIKNSGDMIAGLAPSTNYNIKIVAVDMFYNKSASSNSINITTSNRVATDIDAINYINASANTLYQDIIDDAFISLKSNNLYNKIQAFYPFLGTTQAQHKWNAKNPQDTNTSFRLVFSGGGTHSNLGYQCNGTNAYANSFFAVNLNANINSFGATIVCGTNNANSGSDVTEMGSTNPASATNMFRLAVRQSNTSKLSYFSSYNQANGAFFTNNVDCRGVFTGLRNSISENKLFINKTLKASGTGGGTAPTGGIYIGASNQSSSPFGYSNQRIQFTAIHEGLTDAEVVALHTIIDNFEEAIGRKTW